MIKTVSRFLAPCTMTDNRMLADARRGALRVAWIYALFATFWILLSDKILLLFIDDPTLLVRASMAKGWAFVLVTAALLYFLVSRLLNALTVAHERERDLQAQQIRTLRVVQTIWDGSDEAVFAKDLKGCYTLANKKTAEFVGKRRDELIGRDDSALFPPEEAAMLVEIDRKIRLDKSTIVSEEQLSMPKGTRFMLTTKGPLLDEHGRVTGTFGIARDITVLKQNEAALKAAYDALQEQKTQLKLFIEHAPAALAMLDRNLDHMFASQRWLEVYEVSHEDMSGPNHYDVFPELPEEWRRVHQRALAGEVIRSDGDCFERADGRRQWVRWEVRPWHAVDGTVGGIVIFSEDITAQHQAEEEVRSLNAHLEQRVLERTAELHAANRELDAFAYAVSHDLRAPLRAMDGFAHALIEDYGDRLDGEARVFLDQISIASKKMGELIEGILTLSRSTRGALRREPIDISGLALRVLSEMARLHPGNRVKVEVAPELTVDGDARMVEILMTNLLDNAWKYSSKTESPLIRVDAAEVAGRPGICIEDNGAGFDMAYAQRLFVPFQRLHRQTEFPGTGIGLATVQRIVHRHGGEIVAEGVPGNGARFCFTLSAAGDDHDTESEDS